MIRELSINEYDSILTLARNLDLGFTLNKTGPNDKYIVYVENSLILGFLGYSKLYETVDLLYIFVDEEHRRNKIATKLLEYLLNLDGVEHIMLEVNETNIGAIEFYKKNGFKVLRSIKNYYGEADALVMEKVIS